MLCNYIRTITSLKRTAMKVAATTRLPRCRARAHGRARSEPTSPSSTPDYYDELGAEGTTGSASKGRAGGEGRRDLSPLHIGLPIISDVKR